MPARDSMWITEQIETVLEVTASWVVLVARKICCEPYATQNIVSRKFEENMARGQTAFNE